MPLYEYECVTCSARVERRQRFDEAPLTDCPYCGQSVRRVLHPAGIIFKGSGWYCTDSRPRPSEPGESTTKSETSKSESKEDSPKAKDPVAA